MRPFDARFALLLGLVATLIASACGPRSGPGAEPAMGGMPAGTVAAGAGITAAAAGALWAVGGGCRLQGCPYGTYCNEKTGFCDVKKCGQGCPEGTICNEGLDRCQAAPPAQAPSDMLPQDYRLQNPPGTVR